MFALISEDSSDATCLQVLIRRIEDEKYNGNVRNRTKVIKKGYTGCAEMLRKGTAQLKSNIQMGAKFLIICIDQDSFSKAERINLVNDKVISNLNLNANIKIQIIVPTEELEAWILADPSCLTKVFSSWRNPPDYPRPESVSQPKEILIRASRDVNNRSRPLYSNATHNEKLFEKIDISLIRKKCPSFDEFYTFVYTNI
ncbi:DUF4276 family protein [Vibrio cholerae]|uniref:DUF4276 family protein n=1 Tax=Vibrio cholerae TaxID=666 RepID=UPI001482DAFC|nr:DUF4276 family protein [Vibrio cholerae]